MPAVSPRHILPLLLVLLAPPARGEDVMTFVRADRWLDAAAAAAAEPDPVARKLVTYYRLLAPGGASAAELGLFMADSPDWPLQGTLARRREEALAAEPDDASAAAECDRAAPDSGAALARCAEAEQASGKLPEAAGFARRAWVALAPDPAGEQTFAARWSVALGRAEQWGRFDRLAWSDPAAAARQAARLDLADRPRAEARLAFKRDDPRAPGQLESMPAADREEPALMLEQARYLRRANLDGEALQLWLASGTAAERAVAPEHLAAFWDERNILARRRLRDGDAEGAYALAAGAAQKASEQVAEAQFLAGFIALRRLGRAEVAAGHFATLAALSKAAITQARGHYWLARALTERQAAKREYAAAAAYPNTFYGQLAALALGEGSAGLGQRIARQRDPAWTPGQGLDFAGRELARAAGWLVAWGEPRRAQAFLLRLEDVAPDPTNRSLAARLAAGFGMPETAVAMARKAGRDGVILLEAGWPEAATVPSGAAVEPALALAIIRQESSFDAATVSPVGARGLMQLMPGTAAEVARQVGMSGPLPSLTADTAVNVHLGTAYLGGLLGQFGGCVPMAVAAYNAGPARVSEWLAGYGDPRAPAAGGGAADMIDWIELIPFGETRNYVQRVIENAVVYRAKRGEAAAHPLAQWLN